MHNLINCKLLVITQAGINVFYRLSTFSIAL